MALGTFNTIGSSSDQFGGSTHVWARVDRVIHGGRKINTTGMTPGTVIPAGTLVQYTYNSEYVTILTSSSSLSAGNHYGLIFNDVCIPDNCIFASCAIVTHGVVWADAIDVAEAQQQYMPGIEFIRNHMGNIIYNVTTTSGAHITVVNRVGDILAGSAYYTPIVYADGYEGNTCTVTMGGTSITSTAVNASKTAISIPSVTGNLVINITAKETT